MPQQEQTHCPGCGTKGTPHESVDQARRCPNRACGICSFPRYPVSITEAFAALRTAAGGAWDGVDAEAYVRDLRDETSNDEEIPPCSTK